GILDGVEPVERRFDLHEEDLILMVSDGVPTEEPWVEEQLAAWEGTDPTELCRRIAEAARLRCRDPRPDDITVAALRLEKAE
ncbi:MAG TPA: stage II sporulation protein E, partial [Ruminococcaceae bacterium]|nr:stage II sporulation protein E [Oscillospiraceae bacterium]